MRYFPFFMLFVFTLGRLSSWRLLFLRKRWVNDDSSAIDEQTFKSNYIAQLAEICLWKNKNNNF
jgi:hypothetical protein